MTHGVKTIIYPAPDLAVSKAMFATLLGMEPTTDAPYYAGFTMGDLEIGLDPQGHRDGPVVYWHVDDIAGTVKTLVDAGATVTELPHEVGAGRQIATLTDPAGSPIGLLQDA